MIGGPANQHDPIMVSDLINEELGIWNEALILHIFEEPTANEILAIDLSSHPENDSLMWIGNQTGQYTVKSGYNRVTPLSTRVDLNKASCSFTPLRSLWTRI